MATLSLKISLMDGKVTKTMQFDPLMSTFDACKIIRDKISEANQGEAKDYGIFISSTEDNKIGVWLEPGKNLEFYMLRNGDIVEYKKKMRTLRVRMLDGTLKTMMVDDSQNVANLMVVICTKIGITNYDEYSLVRDDIKEEIENPDKPNYGTLTLKRKQAEKERDVKMDQLRKKLRTDDEVNWIDPSKTLRGQGVDESETVLLRRKYFFSDQNIDSRDPVQLNLLYVQARDAILDGTHPVTLEKACEFAGIQCQIQFGDHKEDKHTTGFLDLREFLPASYMKVKSVEKKVFKAHKNYLGQSELDAKVTYTKTARALSTYGVAFFLVKEKLKGKNKLVPRLLGVTKDSVLRLDERTKEILQTWPLTTVRRWCASPNTFTLDFGDYSDQYYSVQTTEAEQILQLIAGYIDIILKKQKVKDHFGIEGDEGSTMVEDSVSPLKATILQHESSTFGKVNTESLAKPAIMRAGAEAGQKPYAQGHMGGAQFTTISGKVNMGHAAPTVQQQKVTTVMSEPQRALLSTISSGQEVIRITEKELVRAQLPELGSDAASIKWKEVTMDTNKQNVSSQIAAMNAATAQVVTLTSGPTDEVDHTAVGAAITTIASNLPEVTKGVSMIAALMEDNDNGDKLLDATRRLCTAFSDLLKAAEPETKEPRQNLLNAASRVGEASTQVLYTIGEESEESREIQDMLLALAKAVANTTAALVLKAKNVAATCKDDQQAQNRVIGAATQCALATSQLVACAKVVAPTLQSPACRDQLSGAARQVALAVRKLVSECESTAPQGPGLADVTGAAADVARALDQLMHHVNTDRRQQARETIHETHVENIMTTTDRLFSSQGDPAEMVRQARLLGQATAQLIQNIKVEAERQPDSETQRRLMAAAKLLADATAKMVEAARQCASSPHDKVKQEALCRAAEELKYVTVDYASSSPDVKKHLFTRLETVAKQAASTGTQFISSVQNAGAHITNRQSQETLVQESRTMAEHIPRLIEGVKGTMNHPDDSNSQLDLINASEAFLQPGAHAAQAARAVLPTIQDQASALQLNNTTQQLATTCSELRSAVSRARASCSGLELDAAAQIIRSLQRELAEVDQAARDCRLRPLPGETAESASRELGSSNREAAYAVSRLVSAAQQGSTEYAGKAARDTAQALRSAAGASRALAATQPNSATMVITSTQEVMSHSLILVEEVKRCLASHETADHTRLASIAKNVTVALDNSVNSMPSHQDVDQTIESINETLQVLSMGEFPPTNKSYNQLQQDLNVAAEGLSTVAGETAQAASSPAQLGNTSKQFGTAFNQLLGVSMEMAGQTTDYEVQNQMVMSMKNVTVVSAKLLTTARYVSNDPTQPNSKNQLSAAARSVTDSINYLVDVCTSAAPGQKECDSAVRNIQSVKQLLQHPSEPVNELGYYQCVDTIIEHSRILGKDGMSGMANHVQKGEHALLGKSVKSIADSICGLIECTAQSAYLVAVSDPSSVAGRPGLVDQAQFARASQVIQQACNNMVNPTSNEEQVLSAATLIAKHTSALCNACRVASSKTTNPVAKRHFVQSAKDVANSTAHLVKEIKALDSDYSQASRMRCGQATVPLLDAVNSLCQFANSPEFVSVPAKISQQARRAQDPILDSGRKIIQGSCSMIESAKCLAVEPNDTPQWRNLDKHSKTVTESIKSLVNNIRDKAPGQSECLAALDILSSQIRELDQVSLQAVSQNLPAKKGNSLQGYTEQMESSATEMLDKLEQLRAAAKFEAENLGHSVNQMVSYIEPLTSASVGVASNMVDTQQQMRVLDQTKTVLEGCTQLVLASKEAGGNPGATSIHPDVDEYSQSVRDAAADLLANAESLAAQRGIVSGLLDSISRSVTRITDHRMSLIGSFNEADSFVDYQTRMVGAAKEIARLATEMTAKSGTDVSKLATLAGDLTHRFNQLAQDSVGAAATTTNNDVAQRIRSTVVELGNSVITLVKSGGLCQVSKDSTAQRQVADGSKQVSEKVGSVLSALQAGSKGTQACIDAAATVAAIIGDLDTTILFASAGTLHADDENDAFADHRESILKTAKVLVEDTKTLVGGAASSQEQLASAAQNSVSTIVLLSSVVKQGAMSLGSGNPDSQVMLIHSVRDVAAALRDLIQATKDASGKHIGDPAMARLKDSAKVGRCDDLRRWSLPNNDRYGANDSPGIRSLSLGPESRHRNVKTSLSNCDSETDWFISDQEEELIKILQEDSSQDELENNNYGKLGNFTKNKDNSVVSLNSSHTQWSYKIAPEESADEENAVNQEGYSSRTLWKDNMEFRILGYAEMIVLNEIRALEEVVARLDEQEISKTPVNPRDNFDTLKKLDSEMQNIVMTLNEIDNEIDFIDDDDVPTVRNVVDLKVDRRKRVSLSPMRKEQHSVHVENYYDIIRTQEEFWQMFSVEAEIWKALMIKNHEREMETKHKLDQFSGELKIGEFISPEKKPRFSEPEPLGSIVEVRKIVLDGAFNDVIHDLEDISKRNFNFKGFDPQIEELLKIGALRLKHRKMQDTSVAEAFDNIYADASDIENADLTFDQLCKMEEHYEEIERLYREYYEEEISSGRLSSRSNNNRQATPGSLKRVKLEKLNKPSQKVFRDNVKQIVDVERATQTEDSFKDTSFDDRLTLEVLKNLTSRFEDKKDIVTNVENNTNIIRNIVTNSENIVNNHTTTNRFIENQYGEPIKYDTSLNYPMQFYANNWWSIYGDIVNNRAKQFGSLDRWWSHYENAAQSHQQDQTITKSSRGYSVPQSSRIHTSGDTRRGEISRVHSQRETTTNHRENIMRRHMQDASMKRVANIQQSESREAREQNEARTRGWVQHRVGSDQPVMVTNVTSLLKTVKAVEDEHTRGTRALESTIEAIAQEINVLLSPGAPKLTATPEELVRCTKAITVATAKAVAAGNSAKQDDVIAAANIGRRAIGDMLAICKGAAFKCAETQELKARTLKAGNDAASSYRELLVAVLKAVQGQTAARQSFPDLGRAVAQAAAEIVAAAEALKGSDWVDPDDPTVIAENELLGAAASIDAAANKLAALRPRKSIKEADETLNFDEMILDAAKSIIAATSALVRAASAAQRELIDQGKVARRPLYSSDDGQWSEGLISAARLAAAAAHSLAESANALVQGLGSEERLVSSAKQVAGSTAQLLVACKVKADPNSESTRRLQAAGNAVIKSTDNLVRAAQRAISHEEERCLVLNRRMVGGIAQEINARSEVLRIERQLDEARGRLTAIRQAKYKLKGGDTSGDETDNEITLHSGGQPLKQDGGYTSDSPTHGGRNSSNFGQNTTSFGQNMSSFGQNTTTSFGQNRSSFGANNTSGLTDTSFDSNYAQNNTSIGQNTTSFGQNNTSFGQNNTSFGQNNTSFGQNNTSFGQNNSNFGQNTSFTKTSNFSSSTMMDKGLQVKQASPPPPNPPPPMTTNLSTFSRSINTNIANSGQNDDYSKTTSTTIPAQNYEAFTTRSPNPPNKNYETRSFEVPRPLNIITTPEYYSNKMEEEHKTFTESNTSAFSSYSKDQTPRIMSGLEKPKPAGSPLSPKFNAKFDLKREFESSDLSRNNYSQNVLSSNVQDSRTENTFNSLKRNEYQQMFAPKSPVSPKPFVSDPLPYTVQSPYSTLGSKTYAPRYDVKSPKSPSFNTQPGYSETNQSYSFRSETANKGSNIPVANELARITSVQSPKHENVQMFGKEVYTYGGPNYSQETMTEVKDIPNGTQKVTTTKIYSSTPMKITSTNTKYESSAPTRPNFDSLNEFTREFGNNDSNYNTLNSDYGSRATDTMKSFTSQSSSNMDEARRNFMRPSDYKQSDFQSSTTVSKSLKTPAELNKELDSMERKLLKQTISSEVIEKKTVMTTSSKSESSSTTTKKFGNF